MNVRYSRVLVALAMIWWVAGTTTWARTVKDAEYQVIVDRNAFGLRPPPEPVTPPPQTNAPPPAELVNVNLSGISAVGSKKKAWLVVPVAPPKITNAIHLSLREGEKHGDIEIVKIDVNGRSVQILNAGMPATLTFDDNGMPEAKGTPVPVARARNVGGRVVPPRASAISRLPLSRSAASANRQPASTARPTIPNRLPTSASRGTTYSRPNLNAQGGGAIPQRTVRTTRPQTVAPPIDPETRAQIILEQQRRFEEAGIPFPPTPL